MTWRNFRRILTALLLTAFLGPMANSAPSGQLALIPNPTTEVKELILEAFLFPDDYRERIAEYCSNLVGLPTGTPVPLSALKLKPSTPQSRTFKTEYETLIQANNQGNGPKVAAGKGATKIPGLANRVDRVADDVAGAAVKEAEISDEIALTNLVKPGNPIPDIAKRFWANHEMNVSNYLASAYNSQTNIGRQITIDIVLKGGRTFTCRLDNLIYSNGRFFIADAKSSIVKDLSKLSPEELMKTMSTKNQIDLYQALFSEGVQSITPRGKLAEEFFRGIGIEMPTNIRLEKSVDFYVNDFATEGYSIYIAKLRKL